MHHSLGGQEVVNLDPRYRDNLEIRIVSFNRSDGYTISMMFIAATFVTRLAQFVLGPFPGHGMWGIPIESIL